MLTLSNIILRADTKEDGSNIKCPKLIPIYNLKQMFDYININFTTILVLSIHKYVQIGSVVPLFSELTCSSWTSHIKYV